MKTSFLSLVVLCLATLAGPSALQAQSAAASLRGTVTDPSGATVPGALVQLRGPGAEQRRTTDATGQYTFPALTAGKYTVRVIAKGFTVGQRQNYEISGAKVFDYQLTIEAQSQVINVDDEANSRTAVNTDPTSNGGAIVLGQKELAALSDDPDELSQQLQAMAGPGAGPEGGQILHRRIHRRESSAQVLHSRNPDQLESVFRRIRPSGFRAHRNLHEAGHGFLPRPGILPVQRSVLQLAQPALYAVLLAAAL